MRVVECMGNSRPFRDSAASVLWYISPIKRKTGSGAPVVLMMSVSTGLGTEGKAFATSSKDTR